MVPNIEGFDIEERLGSGGSATVFRARQHRLDRAVAIKVLDGLDDLDRVAFERECRVMGALSSSPGIVQVFDAVYTDDGRPCLVMEYFGRGTLRDRISRGPMPIDDVIEIGVELAEALAQAHRAGVVHRDIKPSNLFVSEQNRLALGDFGISTLAADSTVTGGGKLTVQYAPPEVIEGASGDRRGDIYSLAASLFFLASGSKPFPPGPGQGAADIARRILLDATPRLERGDAPAALVDALAVAMAKSPQDRPGSADEFAALLRQARRSEASGRAETDEPARPAGGRSRRSALSGAAALGALLVGGLALAPSGASTPSAQPGIPSERTSTTSDDLFFSAPATPTGIVVSASSAGLAIEWQVPEGDDDGSLTHLVELLGSAPDPGDEPLIVPATGTTVTIEAPGDLRCVTVTAVGPEGRRSPPSSPVCAP